MIKGKDITKYLLLAFLFFVFFSIWALIYYCVYQFAIRFFSSSKVFNFFPHVNQLTLIAKSFCMITPQCIYFLYWEHLGFFSIFFYGKQCCLAHVSMYTSESVSVGYVPWRWMLGHRSSLTNWFSQQIIQCLLWATYFSRQLKMLRWIRWSKFLFSWSLYSEGVVGEKIDNKHKKSTKYKYVRQWQILWRNTSRADDKKYICEICNFI